MHTVRPGIWQKKKENMEKEKCILQEIEYDEKD